MSFPELNNELFKEALGVDISPRFSCSSFGWAGSTHQRVLNFLDDARFTDDLLKNPNVSAVLVTAQLSASLAQGKFVKLVCDDPRYFFYSFFNYVAKKYEERRKTVIDATANVHPSAFVAEENVRIGPRTVVEPHATIFSNVEIGPDCLIGAGAVLGSQGFEYKRTSLGILPVYHNGMVILEANVEIGSNTCVDKGLMANTLIRKNTKIDNLVHISHNVEIGENVFVIAHAQIAGSVIVGNDVWIAPSATIKNGVKIGDRALVGLGAVVIRDVDEDSRVVGNPAKPIGTSRRETSEEH